MTQSLSKKISRTANRLDQREMIASALVLSLRSRVRSAFTSPRGLLIAGSTGFLAAEWLHRPKAPRQQAREQKPKPPRRSQRTLMAKAVLATKLMLDLGARWEKGIPGVRQRTDDRASQAHASSQPGSSMENRINL